MSTQLVTIEPQLPVVHEGVGFASKMFQLKPVVIELTQRTTRGKGVVPGVFREKNGEETYNELKVVILSEPRESRTLFPAGSDLGARPLCRSRDGVMPVTDDPNLQPQAMKCAGCEHSSWKKWQKTRKQEDIPACKTKVTLFMVDRIQQWPMLMSLGGKSLTVKNLPNGVMTLPMAMQQLARLQMKIKATTGKSLNIYDFSMTVKPFEIDGNRGSYYVAHFEKIAPINEDDRAAFGELYNQYVKAARDRYAEEEVEESISSELTEESATGNGSQVIDGQYEV
jgi:hypothetical protein